MSVSLFYLVLTCGLHTANAGVTGLKVGTAAANDPKPPVPTLAPWTEPEQHPLGKDFPWDKTHGGHGAGGAWDGNLHPPLQKLHYPTDKRPAVDVLHFKHPYPVVQDSNDYDADYVKDENSDNGEWHAQTEYDRLRHKLLKEKGDVHKAEDNKKKAEDELQDAIKREKDQEEKVKKHKEDAKKKKKPKQAKGAEKKAHPAGATGMGKELKVAADEVQRAMDYLDECKKQLEEAREKLKKLLKELEEAKKLQMETQAALDAALERLAHLEKGKAAMDAKAKKEYQEYLDAKAAYEKQRALVAKMEADIKISAAKVKAMRDAEDPNGGVYNTGHKSGAAPHSIASVMLITLTIGALSMQ